MIKNNEYLIFKMKKTLLFFTAIINFIGFSFFVNAADVTIVGDVSTNYTFGDEDTLTLKGPANASGKLNFSSGSISISSTDNGDQITGEVNTFSDTEIRIIASPGNTLTISASIGAGSIIKDGEGILVLNQSNDYTGDTTISDGTLRLMASGTLSDSTSVNVSTKGRFEVKPTNTIASIEGSGTIDIETGATLTAGDANDKEFSGTLTGAGRFTKAGTGMLTLSGTNSLPTYSISEGTLAVRNTSTLKGGNLTTDLSNNGHFWYSSTSDQTISGAITGTGSLQKTRTSTLTLEGSNTYSGSTTIGVGTLRVDGTLSDSSAITINANGTYDVNNSDTVASIEGSGIIDIASSTTLTAGDANDKEFSGVIQGAGNFSKSGSGTLTLSGTNTYTGSTTINAGTIDVSGQLNSGNYAGAIANSGTFTFSSDSDQILSGNISGTGALTKSGSSTLTLSGTNTYTGSTTINAGTISVASSANLGADPGSADADNIIFAGGELEYTGSDTQTIVANKGVTISSDSTLNVSNSSGELRFAGSISGSANLTKTGAGTFRFTNSSNSFTGALIINQGEGRLTQSTSNAYNFDVTVQNNANLALTRASFNTNNTITVESGGAVNLYGGTNNDSGRNFTGNFNIAGTGNLNGLVSTTASASATASAITTTGNIGTDVQILGTVTLSADASVLYNGNNIDILGGKLQFGNDDSTTTTAVNLGSNTLTLMDKGVNNTVEGEVGAAKRVYEFFDLVTGTGTLDISQFAEADFTTEGSLADTVNIDVDGTLKLGTSDTVASLQGSGEVNISSGTFTVNQSSTTSYSGIISGAGNFSKSGSGTLTLSGTNLYTGDTNINDGTLKITGALSNSTDLIIASDATLDLQISQQFSSIDLNGTISRTAGTSSLNISGTSDLGGNVTTTGTQTYTGATTLSASNTLTTSNANISFGSTINSDGTARNLTINSGTGITQFAGIVGGTNGVGDIDITGALDLDAAISNASSVAVSLTSNIGADVTTTGTQGYSGTTTLSGGDRILQGSTITMAAVTGTGSHDLTVTGNLDLDGAVTNVVELDITGTSNLGANVTTTGTQNFQGTTTLSGGDRTLTASTVTLNAVTGGSNALTVTGNLDLDGAVSGVTNMSVSGTSNIGADVTTTGTQSYTGTTTVSASSTLNGTEITAAAAVLNNNLNITNSSSSSFTGAISGTGNLTKAGSGTLTLSGTNSYTGDTTISAGTLTVSGTLSNSTTVSVASGAIYDVDATDTIASVDGAGTVDIASSTTLTTGDTNDQELSGTVSGAGSLTKAGSGILTLSGTNSYSGNTNISAGILLVTSQLGEGTYAGNISNSGDFGINSSSNQTLSGVISGSGTINKSGTGELTLTGTNTFNGTINVAGGTLFAGSSSDGLNDITLGDIIVKGGTLGGGGVIGGDVSFTTTGGTLAPGNSIGILTVSGDLTLSVDDTTEIEFNASSADKIVVNGNTILAGTISLFPENTTYSDVSLTIVDGSRGGTFSGTFATETMNNQSNLNGATWDIVYDTVGKTVKLDLTEAETSSNLIKDTTTVNKFKDVATVFDNATTGQLKEIKDVLNSATVNSVNTELGKLKGTVLASTFTQPTLNHNNFNRALTSVTSSNINTSLVSSFTSSSNELTLASLQDAGLYGDKKNFNEYFDYSDTSVLGFVKNNKNRSIFNDFQSEDSATFIRTYGTTADRDNINSNYTGYDSETTGILFGQQFKNDEETFTGYSYGFTGTDTDYKNNYGESKTYSVHASLFKQYDKKDHGLNLISGMYVSKTESERNVSVFGTSVNDKYVSDYWDVGINQEVQYIKKYKFGEVSVSPSAKLNSTYVFKSDTEETGGELALNVDNDNLFLVKPELGISIGVDLSKKDNINNELSLAMFASQDHFIDGTTSNARYSSGSSFNVDLPRDQETYYSLGLGYNFLNKETDTSLMANAFLMQNEDSDMNSNIFSLTFRKLFGDFAKGNVPPVIVKKPENDQEVIKEASPKDKNTIKKVEKTLEEFEENIEIVLKESPTEQEVAKVYESVSNNSKIKKQLTLNDVYNNLSANCYAIENKLVHLVNYYDKQQLYKILDKCNKLSDPKIHLIANRLHQIQLDETTAYQKIYFKYLRILSYLPFVTFVAFIILAYEFIRRYIVNHFRAKNTV
ncbi:autotransporter-associated beta strand repeat-containing protein [Candidatus Pelagibacter sp.]|nr:autotransporter-associated beta strand repeat-containing protein [Candidatus Pelagibacter sp.]